MDGMNKKTLTSEAMLAEARAFQQEVSRPKDHRGRDAFSSPRSGAYGSGDRATVGTSRGVSRQPVAQNLATPEQFFGRPSQARPKATQNTTMPATQQLKSRPADNFEPMQVDPNPGPPQENKAAAQPTGRGLVGSRWATSLTPIRAFKQHSRNETSPVPGAPARAVITGDAGKAGATANNGHSIPSSFPHAPLDTPEVPKASKGLLSSKWASDTFPGSPSPMTSQYPDPSTLEPVYRSDDWLADLSAEYQAMSVKTNNTSETQPTRTSPAIQPAGVQTAAQTAKPPISESQPSGQDIVKSSVNPQEDTTVQSTGHTVAPNQTPVTNAGRSVESGRVATPVQAVSDHGGIFNDSAFKDWYNSQFMRRKA